MALKKVSIVLPRKSFGKLESNLTIVILQSVIIIFPYYYIVYARFSIFN